MFLDTLDLKIVNKNFLLGQTVLKCVLRSQLGELVLSVESAKDCSYIFSSFKKKKKKKCRHIRQVSTKLRRLELLRAAKKAMIFLMLNKKGRH